MQENAEIIVDTLNLLSNECHANANSKGFWEDIKFLLNGREKQDEFAMNLYNNAMATRLALIHSEVTEALEALRVGDTENFNEELADVLIRVFDLCGALKVDIGKNVLMKMDKNKTRPPKHGKRF